MSPNINIMWLIGGVMLIMSPINISAQEKTREDVLLTDIQQLGERAVRDNVITEDERKDLDAFIRDSLPEGNNLKIRALEQIRDELDEQYSEMIRQSQKLLDESGYIGSQMLPDRLFEPDGYESPEEKRRARELAAAAAVRIDKDELLKHVRPLPMNPWLRTILRLLFGAGVNQRPERWDYYLVPQMGGLYHIAMPGGRPDDSWRDAPKMNYDPHPDKHFRR